jgi:hypothetical protein
MLLKYKLSAFFLSEFIVEKGGDEIIKSSEIGEKHIYKRRGQK